jgi:hypothetical protein
MLSTLFMVRNFVELVKAFVFGYYLEAPSRVRPITALG